MKRVLMLILTAALVLSAGCSGQKSTGTGNQLDFYYVVREAENLTEDDTIGIEQRNSYAGALAPMLELYFRGPQDEKLISPFPSGTELIKAEDTDGVLELTMSSEFFSLQGVDLTLACGCLAKTVCAYTGRSALIVSDELGKIRMELNPDSYLSVDSFQQDTDQMFTLYFPDENCRYVIPELREATLSENETEEAYLLRELMAGPQTTGLQTAIPEEAELLSVSTSGGVCSVNFSSKFYEDVAESDYRSYTAIYSIVDTLTALDYVDSVKFLKDGATVSGCGIMLLGEPFSRDTRVIGPAHTTGVELDVNFYMLQRIDDEAFAVPVRVKQSISAPSAEAVVKQLLSYVPPQGFYNPIPFGTEALSVSVSGNTCYLDLSEEFIPGNDTEEKELSAVWSLVSTLTGLDNISSVVLTIEGEAGGLAYVDLSEPLTAKMVRLH